MDDSEAYIIQFPAPLEAGANCTRPAAWSGQSRKARPKKVRTKSSPKRDESGRGPFASQVIDAKAIVQPPDEKSPGEDSAGRKSERKKGGALKLEALEKLQPVAASLIIAAGFAGLAVMEMTRRAADEAEVGRERRSTEFSYPVMVSHQLTGTNPSLETGATLVAGEGSAPSLSSPPSKASPSPLEPRSMSRIQFVPVPSPMSARFDEFADVPDLGGSPEPSAGDDAELDVIEARVKSRLLRNGKLPPEDPAPGSVEDYRRRIESGKDALVKLISGRRELR